MLKANSKELQNKIIFWGTPDFAVPSLKILDKMSLVSALVTQPDKKAGRGNKLKSSPCKEYALANNIPVLDPLSLDNDFLKELKKYLPASFVVVAYGKIIPQSILDLSEKKAINIHPSMLPELRGPSPIQSALLRGFSSTGLSLMQLDKKMDHGPILSQIKLKIEPDDDYLSLSNKLANLGADVLQNSVIDYLKGNLVPQAQADDKATFCKLIKKEEGQIDWQDQAENIHNKIRAYRLWPGAFTRLGDLDIKILKAKISDENLKPGHIKYDKEKILVGSGGKSISILDLQPAGKKVMKASEFIRGYEKYLQNNFQ